MAIGHLGALRHHHQATSSKLAITPGKTKSKEEEKMFKKAFWLVLVLTASLLLAGCPFNKHVVVLPKAPYPYDAHQDAKSATYYLYNLHWQNQAR